MNEALEIAEQIETDHWADHQICEAATLIRSQHAEIERLESSNESYITLANTAYEITDALRTENQKLREALEIIADGRWTLTKCERVARAALGETK